MPPTGTTACDTATGRKLSVGPGKTYASIAAAASAAANGDVVVIAAGDYVGDVATWRQSNLTICGDGGRARLHANGRNAAGKGIWVIQGVNVVIDSIEFHGATVPDQNGAGIRAEGNGLTIVNSGFFDGENGILGPDAGDLTIVRSEFARNGLGDGYTHNIYVGSANKVTVTASFFHQAKIGHNFKSRAKETRIENSYFMDGPSGTASYQVDTPNGGVVLLRGNLMQKGPNADNSVLVNFGSEGLRSGVEHTLAMTHNTLVSTYYGGTFVNVVAGVNSVTLTANLLAGTNSPRTYSGVSASKVVESDTVVSTASSLEAPTDVTNPRFWPVGTLLNQTALTKVPDSAYIVDAPRPFVLRDVAAGAGRRVGALQSAP